MRCTSSRSPTDSDGFVSFSRRLADLAGRHPHTTALTYLPDQGPPSELSWAGLDQAASAVADILARRGCAAGDVIGLQLDNTPLHVVAAHGIWRLGGTVLLLNSAMPQADRDTVRRLVKCRIVIGHLADPDLFSIDLEDLLDAHGPTLPTSTWPDTLPRPGKLSPTGGSTGSPKLISHDRPWGAVPGRVWEGVAERVGFAPGDTQLVSAPLFHNAPFSWLHYGLFEDQHLVLMESFDASRVLDAIETYGVDFTMTVPTMLHRLLAEPAVRDRDLSSLRALYHTGGPCPAWLKRAWIELLGGDRVTEMYGSTEDVGQTIISGTEWLEHPGSVGRPFRTDLRIRAEDGSEAAIGEIGAIYLRPTDREIDFTYIGENQTPQTWNGYHPLGDLGRIDEHGYLHLADRQVDVINSGGVRVLPAEVEAVLLHHPLVHDVAIVGVPDDTWGARVHAVVQPHPDALATDRDAALALEELNRYGRTHLTPEKAPKSYRLVQSLPRNEFGKLRRATVLDTEISNDPGTAPRTPQSPPLRHTAPRTLR